jgi:hypothetical protein
MIMKKVVVHFEKQHPKESYVDLQFAVSGNTKILYLPMNVEIKIEVYDK